MAQSTAAPGATKCLSGRTRRTWRTEHHLRQETMTTLLGRLAFSIVVCSVAICTAIGTGVVAEGVAKSSEAPAFSANVTRREENSGRNRTGRIFFDQLFGIAGSVTAAVVEDEEDDKPRVKNCTCDCGVSNQENRIVGGRPTGVNRYPWIARIVYDGQFHCGASLLTTNYVLTAAHCVRKLKKSKIRIILGDHDQFTTAEAPAKMRMVTDIIRHRNFDSNTYNHDIALLRLRKPVEFTKNIRPICLPLGGDDPAGKEGTVIGWGRTAEGGMLPGVVQEVQIPIWSQAQCRAMKYRASRITSFMLCAGKGKMDSCQGDSGGPLLVHTGDKYEIVGIVSWGVGCGRPGYPGVYTRVGRYLGWLRSNLADTCLCIS